MADRFVLRLSLFYGAFFVYAGISMPFMPAWLAVKGLEAREIGIVLATPLVVRLIAVPLSTRLADRFGLLRQALVAVSIASVAAFVLIGLSSGFPAILAAFALAAMAISPVLPLADAYALRGLQGGSHRYGSVRLWGSVTFIIANLGGGLLLGRLGAHDVIWAVVAALGLTAGAALGLSNLSPEAPGPAGMRPVGPSLWGSPLFVTVVVGSSLIQASHAVMYGFATLQWSAKGIAGPVIGLLWGLGVLAEIALFAVSARVLAALGATPMIVLGGLGGVLRWTAMAFDPPMAALPFLQVLHALSFAATHLGSMHFLGRVAPAGRGATAQGDFAATQGIVFAAAMGVSGVLVASYGSLAYAAMAAAAAAGVVLAVVGLTLERKPPAA
jgi:MFS transporter, PPP family, 3-phenylpropionic acid transporter